MFLENFPAQNQQHGWIEVICGSMFSGKTEELIRRTKRALLANQSVLLVKPKIDQRYATEAIVSHIGTQLDAIPIEHPTEILTIWQKQQVIAIDEAQFFDEALLGVCQSLANQGARVIIAGLDMDFAGKPFGPMPILMATAEYVTKVHAICVKCGQLAHYSHRKTIDQSKILVGATDHYEALCRVCFNSINA